MYRIILLSLLIIISCFSYGQQQVAFGAFYISTEGNDENPGTLTEPVATFRTVQEKIRSFKEKNPCLPINVFVRGGKYYLINPVVFKPEDSGCENGTVKYLAFPGETPIISGGQKLNLKWEKHTKGIFKARIPGDLVFESLYINDQAMIMARYPNYDSSKIFNGYASDCISKSKVKEWKDPTGGYFHVLHKAHWGGFHYRIEGKKTNSTLLLSGGNQNNRPENGIHDEFRFVENIYEELDTLNEWYLDRKTSTLYFMPEPSIQLDKALVEVASLERLIEFHGTEDAPVKHISVEGLKLQRTIRTFMKTTDRLLRSDWTIYRSGAVNFNGAENCSLVNCELSQVGGNAVFINNYNRDVEITGNHIYNVGASGVCLVGDTLAVRNPNYIPYRSNTKIDDLDLEPGPKNNNYPSECIIEDNLIHDTGFIEKQTAGVQISMAFRILVRHNSIYNLPRAGINISEGAWGGHILEFNDVFNTVLETGDHGSFNSWGRDRFWTSNPGMTESRVEKYPGLPLLDVIEPIVIRNNRFRCDRGWDIDLDDGSSNYIVQNNLCLSGGIKLREGYFRLVENNVCVNNSFHPHVWYKNSGDIVRGNIWGSPYQPIRVNDWGTEVDYNIFATAQMPQNLRETGTDRNSISVDPLFIDPPSGNFRVDISSPAIQLGFKNFEMDKFGVQSAVLKAIAETPEIPAIENNFSIDNAGSYDFLGGTVKSLKGFGEKSATGMWEETGVLVVEVPKSSALQQCGFKGNDVILEMGNIEIPNLDALISALPEIKNEKKVKVKVWRNQKEFFIEFDAFKNLK